MENWLEKIYRIYVPSILLIMCCSVIGCNSGGKKSAEDPVQRKAELGRPPTPAEAAEDKKHADAARDAYLKKYNINVTVPKSQ